MNGEMMAITTEKVWKRKRKSEKVERKKEQKISVIKTTTMLLRMFFIRKEREIKCVCVIERARESDEESVYVCVSERE